jgi:hypothetical protein
LEGWVIDQRYAIATADSIIHHTPAGLTCQKKTLDSSYPFPISIIHTIHSGDSAPRLKAEAVLSSLLLALEPLLVGRLIAVGSHPASLAKVEVGSQVAPVAFSKQAFVPARLE